MGCTPSAYTCVLHPCFPVTQHLNVSSQPSTRTRIPIDLPSLTVYESIDLGLIVSLRDASSSASLLPFLEHNYPSFRVDPLYAGQLVVSHAFGVHLIDLRKWMRILFVAMQDEVTTRVGDGAKQAAGSEVTYLLNTFSAEDKCVHNIELLKGFLRHLIFPI